MHAAKRSSSAQPQRLACLPAWPACMQVYRGRLGLEPAAIKVLRGSQLGELDREAFLKEVSILKSCRWVDEGQGPGRHAWQSYCSCTSDQRHGQERLLARAAMLLPHCRLAVRCRSQHLVGFLGAYLGQDEVAIVTELCAGGSLWRALHGESPANGRITWSNGCVASLGFAGPCEPATMPWCCLHPPACQGAARHCAGEPPSHRVACQVWLLPHAAGAASPSASRVGCTICTPRPGWCISTSSRQT